MKRIDAPRSRSLAVPLRIALAALLALAFLAAAGCDASPANGSLDDGTGTQDKGGSEFTAQKGAPTSAIERKVISTASAGLESDDVPDAADRLAAAVEAMGGYVSASSRTELAEGRYRATLTLKVPAGKLAELLARLPEFGRVLSTQTASEDVTDQYYDAQARLTNALAQEAQLLEIMKKAGTIQETLLVRAELDKVQQAIEQLKGQIRLWDALVDMGTLNVTIEPPSEMVSSGGSVFRIMSGSELWRGASRAFLGSVAFVANAGGYLVMAVAALLVPAVLIAAFVLLVVALVRARRRARARRKASSPSAPPAPPAPPAA
jgi:hypothetical protein